MTDAENQQGEVKKKNKNKNKKNNKKKNNKKNKKKNKKKKNKKNKNKKKRRRYWEKKKYPFFFAIFFLKFYLHYMPRKRNVYSIRSFVAEAKQTHLNNMRNLFEYWHHGFISMGDVYRRKLLHR